MIAAHVVDIFPLVVFQPKAILADKFFAFFVVGDMLGAAHVSQLHSNVPLKGRTAFFPAEFRLLDRVGEAFRAP